MTESGVVEINVHIAYFYNIFVQSIGWRGLFFYKCFNDHNFALGLDKHFELILSYTDSKDFETLSISNTNSTSK